MDVENLNAYDKCLKFQDSFSELYVWVIAILFVSLRMFIIVLESL